MSGDNMGGVIITSGAKKETAWINPEGDILDVEQTPRGLIVKGIKEKNEPGYIPTKEEIEHVINLPKEAAKLPENIQEYVAHPAESLKPEVKGIIGSLYGIPVANMPIQEQIEQAEKHLADLRLKKKEEIARRKAELAELEAE